MDPPLPIFTLRGHKAGVTALAHVEPDLLVSGDETGNLTLWDEITFKQLTAPASVCDSKILSLKVVRLNLSSCDTDVLVVQTRNNGVLLVPCDESFKTRPAQSTKVPFNVKASFPTYESLFSRGDSMTVDTNRAILAYPSSFESHLVTIRFLGQDAVTETSGSASRGDKSINRQSQQATVFDIHIRGNRTQLEKYLLFVGYEDGSIVAFDFGRNQTETVPELNVTGLSINVIKIFGTGLTDFVSAFDLTKFGYGDSELICGSVAKELKCLKMNENLDPKVSTIKLSKPGTSAITIRPDFKLFAIGGWDNSISLFSLRSKRLLVIFRNHTKQVSNLLFIPKRNTVCQGIEDRVQGDSKPGFLMYCASLDGTISVFDVY